jgi:hypothetical protein
MCKFVAVYSLVIFLPRPLESKGLIQEKVTPGPQRLNSPFFTLACASIRERATSGLFIQSRLQQNRTMSQPSRADAAVNLGRHQRNCSVCNHEQREEIESAFIGWRSPAAIAEEFALADRSSVYRHANALGLFPKRQRNIRAALERIIEKAGEVDVTASAVVAAIQAYAKINAAGEWIDRTETVSLNDLFDRMSTQELEAYAQTGALPGWFKGTVGATEGDSQERLTVDN